METRPEKKKDKRPRGRPVTNEIEQIPDSPQDIARALFRDADRKIRFNEENS